MVRHVTIIFEGVSIWPAPSRSIPFSFAAGNRALPRPLCQCGARCDEATSSVDGATLRGRYQENGLKILKIPPNLSILSSALGSRPTAGLMTLDHAIKVRILASQPPIFPGYPLIFELGWDYYQWIKLFLENLPLDRSRMTAEFFCVEKPFCAPRVFDIDPRPGVSFFVMGKGDSKLDGKDCRLAQKKIPRHLPK